MNRILAHVHTDGSLHLALSKEDQQEVIAKTVIAASYRYATGHTLPATHNHQISREGPGILGWTPGRLSELLSHLTGAMPWRVLESIQFRDRVASTPNG